MPEQKRRAGELSPFDIADWLWSFRWLAVALFLCAAAWTAFLFWTGPGSTSGEEAGHDVVISLYTAGTPVRSVTEIADIYGLGLTAPGRALISAAGANPIVLHAESKSLAEAAAAESSQLAEQLVADVQAQTNTLAPYMQREMVPGFIAKQYIENVSFLSGVEAGLIQISRPAIKATTLVRPGGPGVRLVLPWIACGVFFLVLSGLLSFVSEWRNRRRA